MEGLDWYSSLKGDDHGSVDLAKLLDLTLLMIANIKWDRSCGGQVSAAC
jgi:hypothetical protein